MSWLLDSCLLDNYLFPTKQENDGLVILLSVAELEKEHLHFLVFKNYFSPIKIYKNCKG